MPMVRQYTDKLLEMVEEGIADKDYVIRACLSYMSEADVEDMMRINDLLWEEEEGEVE